MMADIRYHQSGDGDEDSFAGCEGCEVDSISSKVIVN